MKTAARNFYLYGLYKNRSEAPPVEPGKLKVWLFTDGADLAVMKGPQPLTESFLQNIRERIRAYRDDEDILAWVQPDEPEVADLSPTKLKQIYEIVREEDPYHPVWITND